MMKVQYRGVKCDNTHCGYKDLSFKLSDHPEYVNKPCPQCGHNLLTQEDFNKVKFVEKWSETFFTCLFIAILCFFLS